MRCLGFLFAISVAGCASVPMDCFEACAFEKMICKGGEITQESSATSALFGNGGPVTQSGRSLKYICEVDTARADDIKKIRTLYQEKVDAKYGDDVGIMNTKKKVAH